MMDSPITPQTAPVLLPGVVFSLRCFVFVGETRRFRKVARVRDIVVLRICLKTTHVIPKEPFGVAKDKLRD